MKILIEKASPYADIRFLEWLLHRIVFELHTSLNSEKVNMLEERYKDFPVFKIFQDACSHVDLFEFVDTYVICIDPRASYVGTGYKLAQLCRTVNYGSLDVSSYPIFTKVFSNVSAKLSSYYKEFLEEVLS